MAVQISNGGSFPHASGHSDLLEKLVRFLTGIGTNFTVTGYVVPRFMRAKAGAVAETWTLVCTDSVAKTFSVTGSVSGAQAPATVGVAYENSKVAFKLIGDYGNPAIGNQIVFQTYASTLVDAGQAWEFIKRTEEASVGSHVMLKGRGNAGTDEIFVGLRTTQNVGSDWYNITLYGNTGYIESALYPSAQPGVSTPVDICLTSAAMPYWFIANGRRFTLAVKVSTVYESAYAGFILPTGTPNEYPYPLMIGGSQRDQSLRWSATGDTHRAFWNSGGACQLRDKSGNWLKVQNYNSPTTDISTTPFRDISFHSCIDGTYVVYPVTIHSTTPSINIFGDIDGVFMVSGSSNPSENIVQSAGVDHLVVQNVYRTTINEYAAFRLE